MVPQIGVLIPFLSSGTFNRFHSLKFVNRVYQLTRPCNLLLVFLWLMLKVALCLLASCTGQTRCSNGISSFAIGETECVLLSAYYNDYQWATCLTDAYIRRVSNGDHVCRALGATVCWYQCQLEVNGEAQGQVSSNCRCSNSDVSTTAVAAPTLSPECVSPGALRCNWYHECLEVRYPCDNTNDGYAIEYAEKYCNLFSDTCNYNDFSSSGRQWVDAVRNCLQRALIPTLRPWEVNTCADIRNRAFDSHSGCYTNPAPGAPSICNIPCKDAFKAFWVVNRWRDGAIFTASIETGTQMMEVLNRCFGNLGCGGVVSTTIIVTLPTLTKTLTEGLKVAQFISRHFNFDSNNIGWFPFLSQEDSSDNNRQRRDVESSRVDSVAMILVDLQLLGISNDTSSPTKPPGSRTLDETLTTLKDAVSNGDLSQIPIDVNGTEIVLGVSSLGQCGDALCKNSDVVPLAIAPPPTPTKGSALKVGAYETTIICSAITSLLFKFL